MSLKADIEVAANALELSRLAAEQFVRLAIEAVRQKGVFTVALAGGSTPKSLYALLASWDEPFTAQLPWDKIHFFWGAERHVPPDHPDSNYRIASEAMLARVPVPLENIHRIKSQIADAAKAAEEYEQPLREFFRLAKGQLPRFDLILLGMGPDGHTASIFPYSDVIHEKSHLVMAQSYRITLTPPVLNHAAMVMFLVNGPEKAKVLREVLEGDHQPERLPAQLIRPKKGKVLWVVDQEAARFLSETKRSRDQRSQYGETKCRSSDTRRLRCYARDDDDHVRGANDGHAKDGHCRDAWLDDEPANARANERRLVDRDDDALSQRHDHLSPHLYLFTLPLLAW